jgi:hypothetical protein
VEPLSDDVDGERQEAALHVMSAAEQVLGEERFGGWWIDRTYPRPAIGIAAVDLSHRDVEVITSIGRREGWPMRFVAVRHPLARLLGMLETLDRTPPPGDTVASIGCDPRINSVVVDRLRWDDEAVSWAREHFPDDALLITVSPDASWAATL